MSWGIISIILTLAAVLAFGKDGSGECARVVCFFINFLEFAAILSFLKFMFMGYIERV